ncbi:MAG: polyamine aminopropyltransferase [Chloroflexi bacterium]|nr:polyamine aminopropyltransferase [Chloroflexota bacterium]
MGTAVPDGAPDTTSAQAMFAEVARSGFQQTFALRARLWEGRSAYQHLEILDTVPFGRALVLDGALQTTEADEFCYHELLVHIPLLAHPAPKRVLIVGGGDGGALRHVLMHESVDEAVQVEIDELVVRACQDWLPGLAGGAFEHPRGRLIIGDGLRYLRETRDVGRPFDVILVDSTDPVGPAEGLISAEFYELASAALADDGIFAMQTGSPLLMRDELDAAASRMASVFPIVATYLGHVPSYPGVLWSFTIGSKRHTPREPRRMPPPNTRYYTSAVHRGAFALPAYLLPVSGDTAGPAGSPGTAGPAGVQGVAGALGVAGDADATRGPILG